jgi:hypothetical protein
MTFKQLWDALAGVPLDAKVVIETYNQCQWGPECGENGGYESHNIVAVTYNAQTNMVVLREE